MTAPVSAACDFAGANECTFHLEQVAAEVLGLAFLVELMPLEGGRASKPDGWRR